MNTTNLNETLTEEVLDIVNSEDYQKTLDEEQEAFENGIEESDDPDIELDEEEIEKQTIEFLKLRGKRKE